MKFLVVGVLSALVLGASGGCADRRSDREDATGSCAGEIQLAGRTYVATGPTLRLPRPGRSLGTAVERGCADGPTPDRRLPVDAVPGVPVDEAILSPGLVSVRRGVRPSEALRELMTPVTCRHPGRLSAVIESTRAVGAGASYALDVRSTDGAALAVPYVAIRVAVQVTPSTTGGQEIRAGAYRPGASQRHRPGAALCRPPVRGHVDHLPAVSGVNPVVPARSALAGSHP